MPNIGAFHPQIVHFVVALLFVGVPLRLLSLTGKLKFTGPAAATLLLSGSLAAWGAVQSGREAHGAVERIPTARAAVQVHEEWGHRTANVFSIVAGLEVVGLGLVLMGSRRAKLAFVASAVVGVVGLAVLFEAGDHGGDLVYSYAGGPGLRTGNPDDVGRLYVAGLYEQAMQDRKAGKGAEAADLIAMAAKRFPDDPDLQLAVADSLIQDRKDPQAALAQLAAMKVAPDDTRTALRVGLLKANAHEAEGDKAAARADLETLKSQFSGNGNLARIVDRRLHQLK